MTQAMVEVLAARLVYYALTWKARSGFEGTFVPDMMAAAAALRDIPRFIDEQNLADVDEGLEQNAIRGLEASNAGLQNEKSNLIRAITSCKNLCNQLEADNARLTREANAYRAKIKTLELKDKENRPKSDDVRSLYQRLDGFEITCRLANCFKNEGMEYLGDLAQRSEAELLHIPNLGRKSVSEARDLLRMHGLEFGTVITLPDWKEKGHALPEPPTQDMPNDVAVDVLAEWLAGATSDRNKEIVLKSFDLKRTLVSIAQEYGISHSRVWGLRRTLIRRAQSNSDCRQALKTLGLL